MYTITKEFTFSASHQLAHLPDCHKCSRLHGHNYVIRIEVEAQTLDVDGFVVDYGDLAPFQAIVDGELDHRHLNDVLGDQTGQATTAEHLACWLWHRAFAMWGQKVSAVSVSETPKTWATYRP